MKVMQLATIQNAICDMPCAALLPCPPLRAAAAAKQAQEAFERGAARHGFELQHLPKVAGDAAAREQLKAAGGVRAAGDGRRWWWLGERMHDLLCFCCVCVPAGAMRACDPTCPACPTQHAARRSRCPACRPPAVGEGEYFVAVLPDGSRLVHPIAYGERFPLNYGREVLAELAGVPQRWALSRDALVGGTLTSPPLSPQLRIQGPPPSVPACAAWP